MSDLGETPKVPYEPSQTKRFEVSKDPFSRERVTTIHTLYKELTGTLPGVPIGLSLFGSLSKGKILTAETAPHADVDLTVFVDTDNVDTQYDQLTQAHPRIAEIFAEMKSDSGNAADDGLKRVSVLSYVDEMINEKFKNTRSESGELDVRGISINGKLSILRQIQESRNFIERHPEPTSIVGEKRSIASYFGLDIGGGLRKYKKAFLEELALKGQEAAESTWQYIRKIIEEFERGGQISEQMKRQYPQTFADACKAYGVKPA